MLTEQMFDKDGSGFIEEQQLKRIMIDLDNNLETLMDDMIAPCQTAHDDQGNTLVNYLEFVDKLYRIL
jgi:Ca2+-binding EF-hand superfamily protein